jgi:hypothetical protein
LVTDVARLVGSSVNASTAGYTEIVKLAQPIRTVELLAGVHVSETMGGSGVGFSSTAY